MSGHLLLIDASGFAHRAFWSNAAIYRQSDGLPTFATLGFMALVWRLLGAAQADPHTHAAAVFDAPGKTFRHRLYPSYKGQRERSEELTVQLPWMRHAAEALGLVPVEAKGFEADDVIATLATNAARRGMRTTIVSSDKDMCQLVIDGLIEIIEPRELTRIAEAGVIKKFGVPPKQVPDVQALSGDAVDNIPGVDGIGALKAAAIVRQYGGIKAILKGLEAIPAAYRVPLKRAKGELELYLRLTTLRRNTPLPVTMEALEAKPVLVEHVMKMLKTLEASERFAAVFNVEQTLFRNVEPFDGDPLEWWREELAAPGQTIPPLPQCGFYQRKLVQGGVFVPARIWRDAEKDPFTGALTGRDILQCEVGGKARDPFAEWTRLAMKPIRKEAFNFEKADSDHAKLYRPNDPKATPHKPIDLLKAPAPHNPNPRRRTK